MKTLFVSLMLVASVLLVGASPVKAGKPTSPASPTPASSGKLTVHYDTNPVCNCTGAPAEIQICHSQSVSLDVGTKYVTASTGYSSSECASQEKGHGECLFWRYTYECCYGGWWSGWECTLVNSKAMSSTTDC